MATGAQWLFCWTGLLTFLVLRQPPAMNPDGLTAILTLTAAQITAAGLLFVGTPDSLSRRVSRGLPRSRVLRVLWAPFLPGAARGLLYAVMSLVLLAFFVTVLLPQLTLSGILNDRQATLYAIALAAYSLIYLGAGTLLGRLLRRVAQRIHSYQVLAILALVNLLLIVAAEVIHFLSRVNTPQLFDVVNPVLTLRTIADAGPSSVDAVSCIVVAAVVAIAANMSALWCGVRDIVKDPVRGQIEGQSHPAGMVD